MSETQAAIRPKTSRAWLIALLLFALCAIAYGPALNGPYIWDDSVWLTANPAVRHSDINWIWQNYRSSPSYYPLTVTSFWLEYRIWGFWAPGYRAVNIILHATSAFMLWRLLKKIKMPGALLAAILWAVHPLQVETVVWVTERKNTLSGVLFFASLLLWLRMTDPAETLRRRTLAYGGALIFFALSLFAKTATLFMPIAALLLTWYALRRWQWRYVILSMPFFAIAGVMASLTMFIERYQAGANFGPDWDLSLLQRWLLAGHCFWFYIGKIIWPTQFALVYPKWDLNTASVAEYAPLIGVGVLFVSVICVGWFWHKRGPLVAAIIYTVAIFPVLGFVKFYTQLYTYTADHYAYLASAAAIAFLAAILANAWQFASQYKEYLSLPKWLPPAAALILSASLTILSFGQSVVYQSFIGLWGDTLAVNPRAWIAYFHIGSHLLLQYKMPQQALEQFNHGIAIRRHPFLLGYAGAACELMHNMPQAKAYYEEAIEKQTTDYYPYIALAHIELNAGNKRRAAELAQEAIEREPLNPEIWYKTGMFLHFAGDDQKAMLAFQRALQIDPDTAPASLELGSILLRSGKAAQALGHLHRAADAMPRNITASERYAEALSATGNSAAAAQERARAAQLSATQSNGQATQPATTPN